MKIISSLSVILLISTAPFCQARLGESETQCDIRYNPVGKRSEPFSEDKTHPLSIGQPLETTTYIYQGWKIRIGFLGTMACCMEYTAPQFKNPDATEIDAILKANEQGGSWQRISLEQAKTNSALAGLWKYTGGTKYYGGYWLRSDGSIAYSVGSKLRLEHKKAVTIGLKWMREPPKKEPAPKF